MATTTLYCQAGDHDWERESQRGRKPHSCPDHQEVEVTSDEATTTPTHTISATERVDRLEMMLKSRGTHLSQVGTR